MIELNDYVEVLAMFDKGPRAISEFSDQALDAESLLEELDNDWPFNHSRREYCEFIGVGESTLTGWLKQDRIPRAAKIAHVLLHACAVLASEVKREKDADNAPKVIFDGKTYQLVLFTTDEHGSELGTIIASNIPSHQAARVFAQSLSAFQMLEASLDDIDDLLDRTDNQEYKQKLAVRKRKIIEMQYRAFAPAAFAETMRRENSLDEVMEGKHEQSDLEKNRPKILLKDAAKWLQLQQADGENKSTGEQQ